MSPTRQILEVMGGSEVVGNEVRTLDDLSMCVRQGLPYAALEAVQSSLQVTSQALAKTLQLPVRTVARRKQERKLRADESDRLFRVARVWAHALDVFGSNGGAAQWLQRPNKALAGQVPFELLDTDIGVQQVDDVLGRIAHGVYS